MRFRALAVSMLCASVLWPLRVLACINSMDASTRDFTQSFWVDLGLWSVGAVFLNRVVLFDAQRPTAKHPPGPSRFRRAFFLLVSAAFVLLLAVILAGAPLLNFDAEDFARCAVSLPMLLVLVASPVVLFSLQSAFFHGPGVRLFRHRQRGALASLLLSSLLLVIGVGVTREVFILPNLCHTPPHPVFPNNTY
ncbi:hypothetical protein HUW62_00110 [Myxococcus sp. AM011]|uniref:hypothetical protein n=1 Tax=Myxococcus sp. AM011 TaxID=2745200 RepID=UPI00159555C5|nr:hypothetical protein [Myxococcus sp. AM011]NVJ19643.1 hypothetical protein [Myxococcus sp. AM011]